MATIDPEYSEADDIDQTFSVAITQTNEAKAADTSMDVEANR
jgi:hypothetical protein